MAAKKTGKKKPRQKAALPMAEIRKKAGEQAPEKTKRVSDLDLAAEVLADRQVGDLHEPASPCGGRLVAVCGD